MRRQPQPDQIVWGDKSDGAASVIRTRDLTLTKGALYRWSYGSIPIDGPDLHEIMRRWQAGFWRVESPVCRECVRTPLPLI